jgi:uncharacterized protein (DUF2236 family)
MDYFVQKDSVVRKIWGKSDTILFIFAGAAAEFALNKAVDWLYFTGRLPSDPLGRLFSTVAYARVIVFAPLEKANKAISSMRQIHGAVEQARGAAIPDWAYRDVLYMLIYYSIASFELLERKLTPAEKEEVFSVFYRVGEGMGLKDLPQNFNDWEADRQQHMVADLKRSAYTDDLFLQYKKHLGSFRFKLLKEAQLLVIPSHVQQLLQFRKRSFLSPFVFPYRLSRAVGVHVLIQNLLLPPAYRSKIRALDAEESSAQFAPR